MSTSYAGEPCTDNAECWSGLCTAGACHGVGEGELCRFRDTEAHECDAGLRCLGDRLVNPRTFNCTPVVRVLMGVVASGFDWIQVPAGGACEYSGQCDFTSACIRTTATAEFGTCVNLFTSGEGEACMNDEMCDLDLVCDTTIRSCVQPSEVNRMPCTCVHCCVACALMCGLCR